MDKCDTCLLFVFKACKRVQAMAWIIIILYEEKMNSEGTIGWGDHWKVRGDHNLSKVSKEPKGDEHCETGKPNPIQEI